MCLPHLEPPSHLPLRLIPLGGPRAPALGALLHASNLHWSSILHKDFLFLMQIILKVLIESVASVLCFLSMRPMVSEFAEQG